MKINDIVFFEVRAPWEEPAGRMRVSLPLDLYPDQVHPYPPNQRKSELRHIFVEIHAEGEVSGLFGPIEARQAYLIATQLRPLLLGQDALATELLFEILLRLDRHGRSGVFMTAISAIDCALWDLKGRAWGQPVYRLLGGPTRSQVPAYASMLGHSIEPEEATQGAADFQAQGFPAQKWFFHFGPGAGQEGLECNIALAQALRDAVGPHYPLMFDAFTSWTVPYARQMLQALEPLNPTWMEEPIAPERIREFRKLRQASRVPIATGEHVYTRWQSKELLVNDAVDVLQNDPDWTGGISETVKICALASAFEVPFIAHGHSLLPALHVAASQSPATVPWVEYLVYHQPPKQHFQTTQYEPQEGHLALPESPGLGLVLDESKIESREELTFQP
ncbi:MAG: mandelate racemase/muconate lactonizing protein [Anaerolineae bacterium]|nr:mandelate racemase/muconate lactonizing protein [Anaerolineae bacterium]